MSHLSCHSQFSFFEKKNPKPVPETGPQLSPSFPVPCIVSSLPPIRSTPPSVSSKGATQMAVGGVKRSSVESNWKSPKSWTGSR